MAVLITGAGGFVGGHLIQLLQKQQQSIFAAGLGLPHDLGRGIHLLECDVRDAEAVERAVSESQPSEIYHLAAISTVHNSLDPSKIYDVNFGGSLNLLEAVRKRAPKACVVLVGSAQVYGMPKDRRPIPENAPLRPESAYATSKAAADLLGFQYWKAFGLRVIRARPFNHTGPGQPPRFVCSDFAKQAAEIAKGLREPVISVGNLEVQRDFSDVRDVVRAYNLLASKGRSEEPYNVCSGRAVSIKQILQILCGFVKQAIEIRATSARTRPSDITYLRGSARLVIRRTGWKPNYSLQRTLKDLFLYWSAQSERGGNPASSSTSVS